MDPVLKNPVNIISPELMLEGPAGNFGILLINKGNLQRFPGEALVSRIKNVEDPFYWLFMSYLYFNVKHQVLLNHYNH